MKSLNPKRYLIVVFPYVATQFVHIVTAHTTFFGRLLAIVNYLTFMPPQTPIDPEVTASNRARVPSFPTHSLHVKDKQSVFSGVSCVLVWSKKLHLEVWQHVLFRKCLYQCTQRLGAS